MGKKQQGMLHIIILHAIHNLLLPCMYSSLRMTEEDEGMLTCQTKRDKHIKLNERSAGRYTSMKVWHNSGVGSRGASGARAPLY